MMTTLDQIDALFTYLTGSALDAEITGEICKHSRTQGSNVEDVVIKPLGINGEQLQQGIVNINIYVSDIPVTVGGNTTYEPDHVRLKALATLAAGVLKDVWQGDWHFNFQQQTVFPEQEFQEHFINIRIEFFSINL